jgi:hypothetical protein
MNIERLQQLLVEYADTNDITFPTIVFGKDGSGTLYHEIGTAYWDVKQINLYDFSSLSDLAQWLEQQIKGESR